MRFAALCASSTASATVAALLFIAPAAAQNPDAADEALRAGDAAEAKAQFEIAAKHNPTDYNAAFSYMSTLPAKDALRAADSISRAATVPEWAKAAGLRILGDHSLLKEDYKKAADAYLQASKLDSATAYKHLYALSIAMDGQTEAARAIWNEIALGKNGELSGEAARMLAQLPKPTAAQAPANPPPAAPVNQQTAAIPANQPSNTPAKATDAPAGPQNNTSVQTAAAPVNQPNNTPAQPAALVNPPSNPPAQPAVAATPVNQPSNTPAKAPAAPANPTPTGIIFTVQVGAFATKENADNLVKRLTGKYDDITVTATASGGQTLYRVRVGSFQRKEDAGAFADRLIIEAGLSARVTEK